MIRRSFPEHLKICIFIRQLEMIVSVSRVTEETPDEDTSVVSKRRVLKYYVGNKFTYTTDVNDEGTVFNSDKNIY